MASSSTRSQGTAGQGLRDLKESEVDLSRFGAPRPFKSVYTRSHYAVEEVDVPLEDAIVRNFPILHQGTRTDSVKIGGKHFCRLLPVSPGPYRVTWTHAGSQRLMVRHWEPHNRTPVVFELRGAVLTGPPGLKKFSIQYNEYGQYTVEINGNHEVFWKSVREHNGMLIVWFRVVYPGEYKLVISYNGKAVIEENFKVDGVEKEECQTGMTITSFDEHMRTSHIQVFDMLANRVECVEEGRNESSMEQHRCFRNQNVSTDLSLIQFVDADGVQWHGQKFVFAPLYVPRGSDGYWMS